MNKKGVQRNVRRVQILPKKVTKNAVKKIKKAPRK